MAYQEKTYTEQDIRDFLMKQSESKRPGPGFQEYRLPECGAMRNESLGMEAAIAGYGSSRWDEHIEFRPGMDLKAARKVARDAYISNVITWVVISVVAAALVYAIVRFVNEYKKKPKKKKESNIEEALLYVKFKNQSDRTESEDSDQGNCRPS